MLTESSGESPPRPRHRAGVASMVWRSWLSRGGDASRQFDLCTASRNSRSGTCRSFGGFCTAAGSCSSAGSRPCRPGRASALELWPARPAVPRPRASRARRRWRPLRGLRGAGAAVGGAPCTVFLPQLLLGAAPPRSGCLPQRATSLYWAALCALCQAKSARSLFGHPVQTSERSATPFEGLGGVLCFSRMHHQHRTGLVAAPSSIDRQFWGRQRYCSEYSQSI